jgi:hypothetical protein
LLVPYFSNCGCFIKSVIKKICYRRKHIWDWFEQLSYRTCMKLFFFFNTPEWAKVHGYQTLRANLMICGPKTHHQNFGFQFAIKQCFFSLILIRADLLRIESWNFGGGSLGLQIIFFFSVRVWNQQNFPPYFKKFEHLDLSY